MKLIVNDFYIKGNNHFILRVYVGRLVLAFWMTNSTMCVYVCECVRNCWPDKAIGYRPRAHKIKLIAWLWKWLRRAISLLCFCCTYLAKFFCYILVSIYCICNFGMTSNCTRWKRLLDRTISLC